MKLYTFCKSDQFEICNEGFIIENYIKLGKYYY